MRPGSLSRPVAFLLVAAAGSWLGCGGGGADLAGPALGSLDVTTTTSGPEPDPDGYSLNVDGSAATTIGTNATRRQDGLSPGTHTVTLSGVAANCTVSAGASRSVNVTANEVATAEFAVACAPTTGAIRVSAQTGGADLDPDGYSVALDDGAPAALGSNATYSWPGLAPGAHTLALTGLAGNCRVADDNPRAVTVTAGDTADVVFAVTCEALPPATGTLELTTTTAGQNPDPDGYAFAVDGGAAQPIGLNAGASVAGLAAGAHTVELTGIAANCAVDGDNPRPVTVPADGTARVAFAVTCSATAGSIEVTTQTTGSPADPDGYQVSVDGGARLGIGTVGSVTFDGVEAGTHTVLLEGAAANCTVQGSNPRGVTVEAARTASLAFTISCAPTTGGLEVTISGLPAGTDAAVTVTGPSGFSRPLTATTTLAGLQPGSYTVAAAQVTSSGTIYAPSPASKDVAVAAGETARTTVTYASAGPGLNLRIDGWYIAQSTQSPAGDVPLVTNRDGYIRVFVLADGPNTARPKVRVRLSRNGTPIRSLDIVSPSASTPTRRTEAQLETSWNVKIPRDLIAPGLQLVAEVDPDNAIAESNETDNTYPRSGTAFVPQVYDAPVLGITFVPVRQGVDGPAGDVTETNRGTYLELSRRMHPLSGAEGSTHAVFTTSRSLQADNANGDWLGLLNELDALRVAEGTGRNYFGVVHVDYASGIAGLGFIGLPTAVGYDRDFDRSRVVAHELGHNWGRGHAPCGGPTDPDPFYPYSGGLIGVYGIDMQHELLKPPELPDIMAYCSNPWISDYTYRGVLDFRRSSAAADAAAAYAPPQRSLLVWGRIVNGRPVLEPAFEVVTRPNLPRKPGRYTVEALAPDGRVFALSFDPAEVADAPGGGRSFAFAVPLGAEGGSRIAELRMAGPAGAAAASRVLPPAGAAVAAPAVEARRTARGVALRWDAAASPMILVRDPDTGEVLSFARGGSAEVATGKAALDLIVSDRVGSRPVRVRF